MTRHDIHTLALRLTIMLITVLLAASCARMGSPDGGWYDDDPPKVVASTPLDGGVNIKSGKIKIYFDEYIKLDNATEKVVVSPPQLETPEIKTSRKYISVELKDSLKPNTTYTIDFSDAISDNNEGNPMGNYTFSFSTGEAIDTLEVSGTVLSAENLEPVKGILVGLYDDLEDSAFTTKPMLRVSRTDSRGRFVIRGIAPGKYRAYALQDMDGNFMFSQKSETMAFSHNIFSPSAYPDTKPDTTWLDSLHIKSIESVPYTHFVPDDITLLTFTETNTDRFFLKQDRKEDYRKFTFYFTYGSDSLPEIKGLNFNADNAFIVEPTPHKDTITYWIKDTTLCNQDTLEMALTYLTSDTLGALYSTTDTLEIIAKDSYEKRQKREKESFEKWQKEQEKKKKKEQPYDSIRKPEPLKTELKNSGEKDPDTDIKILLPTPVAEFDTSKVHLYVMIDSMWYNQPFRVEKSETEYRTYNVLADWQPETEYSFEVDSAAIRDIYGKTADAIKSGVKVKSLDAYSSVFITISGTTSPNVIVQLIDKSDKPVKSVKAVNGKADFYYVKPSTYYMRAIEDTNGNGIWDTGKYSTDTQPEAVYYYPGSLECKAKWDVNQSWNVKATPLTKQKPEEITKQKADKEKKKTDRNLKRAQDLGIEYIPKGKKIDN